MTEKCAGCEVIEGDVLALNTRLQKLEHSHGRMQEAFVKNDIGLSDYDGHRTAHKTMIDQAAVMDGYKRDATKTALGWILAFIGGIFSLGFVDWLKTHIK